jgi:flagellar biosynthesis component FlhA
MTRPTVVVPAAEPIPSPHSKTTPRGVPTVEPVFQLPTLWIGADQKEQAELRGYTVVDPETVLITHLSETLRRHASELLGRDDVQRLVDHLRQRHPAAVNGVVPEVVTAAVLARSEGVFLYTRWLLHELQEGRLSM